MRPVELVWHPAERRLRTPVRLLLAVVVAAGLSFAGLLAVTALGLDVPPASPQAALLGSTFLNAALVGVIVWIAAFAFDRRRLPDYGLALDSDWALDFGFGLALGAALVSLAVAVEVAAGWAAITGTIRVVGSLPFPLAFLAVVGAFVAVGVSEEVAVRGYLLTNVAEALRPFGARGAVALAVILSSVTFGALHAANPNATAVSVVGIAVAGVMLGLGYVLTGEVGLPAGLHVAWNAFLGPVYGFPVSGIDVGVSLLVVRRSGPAVLTGGPFGPEAGLVGIGASLAGSGAIAVYARRRYGPPDLDTVVTPNLRWRTSRSTGDGRDGGETDDGTGATGSPETDDGPGRRV